MTALTTTGRTPTAPALPDDAVPPVVIARRYAVELGQPLGQGGMAIVYLGRDLKTRRQVALKTLRLEYRQNPETRARFRQEVRRMAFLDHPNIAKVYDILEEAEAPWAVMEYVPGETLKDLIADEGPFSPERTADVLDQVAAALEHIHAHKLVHLDVKPQNLLVTPDGVVKLIDFGLAQAAGSAQELIGGTTFGTAAYLSPEQAAGAPVDRTADVYALGCVVYEMLTGQPPYQSAANGTVANDLVRAHLEAEPEPPSAVRPDLGPADGLDDIVLWAMAKDPVDRFTDAASFARVFRAGVDAMGSAGIDAGLTVPLGLDEVPWGAAPEPAPARPHRSSDRPLSVPRGGGGPTVRRRRVHESAYRLGGKAVRHTRPLRRLLWRLVAVVAVANLLLASALLLRDGPEALRGRTAALHAGGSAVVRDGDLLLRSAPGTDAESVASLAPGTEVELRGTAVESGGMMWWPVVAVADGTELSGYAWSGGLESEDRVGVIDSIRDGFERTTGWFR